MPTDYRLVQVATFQTKFEDKSPGILTSIKSIPGQTTSEIASSTGDTEADVNIVLKVLEQSSIIVSATSEAGILVHWHVSDWSNEIESNLADARTWQSNNNGALMSTMGNDLDLFFEIADRLGWILEYEGTTKRADA
jgi:predicted transcriptional regulator